MRRLEGLSSGTRENAFRRYSLPVDPARKRRVDTMTAGLLTRGSRLSPGLPGFPVAIRGQKLPAHSCGGSHGRGSPRGSTPPVFPISPRALSPFAGNRRNDYRDRATAPSSNGLRARTPAGPASPRGIGAGAAAGTAILSPQTAPQLRERGKHDVCRAFCRCAFSGIVHLLEDEIRCMRPSHSSTTTATF
jgi:hypothetical protein